MGVFLEFDAYSEVAAGELSVTLNGGQVTAVGGNPVNTWAHYGPFDVSAFITRSGSNQLVFTQQPSTYNPVAGIHVYESISGVTLDWFLGPPISSGGEVVCGIGAGGPCPSPTTGTPLVKTFTAAVVHLLVVNATVTGIPFTISGSNVTGDVTPFAMLLDAGGYTINMPATVTVGTQAYLFQHWQDNTTNASITINLAGDVTLTATFLQATPVPTAMTLVLDNQNYFVGQVAHASGVLTNASTGAGIGAQSLTVSLDGTPIQVVTTAADGSYQFSIQTTLLAPGPHTLQVSYQGAITTAFLGLH
jgi:hypothetical protein